MKKMLLNSKVVPLDVVGCRISLPFSAFRLPFFGGGKKLNFDGLVLNTRVSRNACIMYAKSTGEALSPCWTPVLYFTFIDSFSSLQLMAHSLYIFFTTLVLVPHILLGLQKVASVGQYRNILLDL
jgi:hypothetical protein